MVYRLWACARLSDILKWQERWIHPSQRGFRKGHRTDEVFFDLCTDIEDALLGGKPLVGIALDYAKCFDRIPQELTFKLAEELGMHPKLLRPLRAAYKQLDRRFKLPLGVGAPFTVTNGILQGCPISVVMVNALLAVLTKAILAEVPSVWMSSYADDAYITSRFSEESVQAAIDKVEEFCGLTGMALNEAKTLAFGTADGFVSNLRAKSGHRFGTTNVVKGLGAIAPVQRSAPRHSNSRCTLARIAIQRLAATSLSFGNKARILAESILP